MTVGGQGAALEPRGIAELLESTCALIEAEMNALGDDGCRFHFKAGEWCVNECVGHIIEADRRGFGGRIKDTLAGKPLHSWDQTQVPRPWARVVMAIGAPLRVSRDADADALEAARQAVELGLRNCQAASVAALARPARAQT